MLLLEYWKQIPGSDRYEASYSGKIRHLGKVDGVGRYKYTWVPPQIVNGRISGGYIRICVSEYGKTNEVFAHVLIGKTFIPNPDNLPEINHLNADKFDNRACNLEWCTRKQNMQHASKMGLLKNVGRKKKAPANNRQGANP